MCGLVVRCAVYVFWLFHLFPYTAKWVCREIYLKRSSANYPRKYVVLWFFSWQQNHALNVPRHVRFDVKWRYCCEIRAWKTIECGFLCVGRSQFGYFRVLTWNVIDHLFSFWYLYYTTKYKIGQSVFLFDMFYISISLEIKPFCKPSYFLPCCRQLWSPWVQNLTNIGQFVGFYGVR